MQPLKKQQPSDPEFEQMLEQVRPRLRAFLLSLTGSQFAAEDLTQETSLVLWDKREEYDPSGDFRAWAFRIAFFQAQNFRRKEATRQRRELPGEGLFGQIADHATERHGREEQEDSLHQAMIHCLAKLRTAHRDLVLHRYRDGRSLEQLSSEAGTNRNAMAQKLFRLKRTLLSCIEKHRRSDPAAGADFPLST